VFHQTMELRYQLTRRRPIRCISRGFHLLQRVQKAVGSHQAGGAFEPVDRNPELVRIFLGDRDPD
jgi:hypothetical protein